MVRGIYTLTSSLITLQAKQGVITNNLTNVNTPGFKSDDLVISQFDSVMISNRDNNRINRLGEMSMGSKIDSTRVKFEQGTIKETGRQTDFALNGSGFFTINQGEQEFYTRDGSFMIDLQGNLTTTTGGNVMGTNLQSGAYEPINVGNAKSVQVDNLNTLILDGEPSYRIRITNFNDYNVLEKAGANLYIGEGGVESLATNVKNNSIEVSTVDSAGEMIDLTNTLRSFESSMKILSYLDESVRIAANDIGKVQ